MNELPRSSEIPLQLIYEVFERLDVHVPRPGRIGPESRLIEDLGMDSLKLVDLAFALEERIGLPVALHDWVDESTREARPLTVATLASFCGRATATVAFGAARGR